MESAAYEGGGVGGKLRSRPLRRAAAPTPYDRPPAAARGGLRAIRNGWLSRLVDPASRIITGGASRLFSSVFRKPLPALPALPAPPLQSEENLRLTQEVPEDACLNSLSEVQEKGKRDGEEHINNSESDGISELEQLMKQKTFTRAEFNHLTELLRARTIELIRTEPIDDDKEVSVTEKDKGTGPAIFNGNATPPKEGLTIPKEEASPAEIAKAYMGSRTSKLPSLRHGPQSPLSREDVTLPNSPFVVKPSDLSVAPKSIVPFSRAPEQPENGYFTPRSRGRSAIYRMSRSPYFKVHTAANVKGGMPAGDGYIESSTSSPWTTTNLMASGGKQALKRGSSVLDSDFGSFGPIRRIRQKSNVMSPLNDMRTSVPEKLLPSASTPLSKNAIPLSTSSIQKHLRFNLPRHGPVHPVDAEHDDMRSSVGVPPIPPQSGEMARKILQQLDKLVPSPKEKSSEFKTALRDDTPSKLTLDMLHGRALRSMEHIGPANFVNARASDNVDPTSDSHPQSPPQKQEIQGNEPSKSVVSHAMPSESDSKVCTATPATDAKPGKGVPDFALLGSAAIPSHEKPAFKISAPEDSLEMEDDDECAIASAPGPVANGKDKQDLRSDRFSILSETQTSEKLVASTPQSMHATSTKLSGEFDGKTKDRPVGFSFPITPVSSTIIQPRTPTMPAPKPEISAQTKEETSAPVFNLSSKDAPTTIFSLNTSGLAGVKSDTSHASESELSISSNIPSTQAEGLNLDRGDKNQKASEGFKTFVSSVSPDLPTSPAASIFAFGASAPGLNNGSLNPNPSTIFGFGVPNSGSQSSSIFSTNSSATTSSSSISFLSSAAAMFSTDAAFKFGSGTTTSSSSSVSRTLETVQTPVFKFGSGTMSSTSSSISTLETAKTPAFNFSSTLGTSAAKTESSSFTGSSGSSTSLISSPFSSANGASSALNISSAFSTTGTQAAPSLFTSTVSGTAAQVGSSLFSSSGSNSSISISSAVPSTTFGSHSSLSSSFQFSSTGNGIFGFGGASAQSNGSSSLTLSSTSSQNSTSNFGATASPIFGAQATSSASGISTLAQNTGQLNSFSSTPSFGTSGSPSFGFGSSPFGAAASSAKPFISSSSGFTFSANAGSSSSGSSPSFATSAASLFSLTSQSSAAPLGTTLGSSSPSAGLTFGMSAPASGGLISTFGSSTGPGFSFNSAGAASTSTPAQPSFGISPVASFGSGFPQNDQMSVEDSMTDDAVQPSVSTGPTFGQPPSSPPPSGFTFGSSVVPSGGQPVFQFSSQNSVPLSSNPFQSPGTLEFASGGGSFSLGSGGGDKSTRKIVKVRRNKPVAKK